MPEEKELSLPDEPEAMHHREITLPDGRYMIFYTFEDQAERSAEQGAPDTHV
jgi:hypothetical protein